MPTTYSKVNNSGEVLIHCNANDTIVVAGNNTTSNLTTDAAEVVLSAKVNSIQWGIGGSATGHIVISQGNSTANSIVAVLTNTGEIQNIRAKTGNSTILAGSIYVTFVGSANGFVTLSLKKNV